MPVARYEFPYKQVADHYAALIASGDLREGDRLPSLGQIAADQQVSHETAHRAMGLLQSRKLIITIPREGSFVGAPRELPGPQQVLAGTRWPTAELTTVTAAELVSAPEYVVPILGLLEAKPGLWPVIRREQVSFEAADTPVMLSVSWHPPEFATAVPQLLAPEPLAPGETVALIGQAAGRVATRWAHSWEARQIRDDGREGPLLHLPPGGFVSANTYTWHDSDGPIEYLEIALVPDRVIVNEWTA